MTTIQDELKIVGLDPDDATALQADMAYLRRQRLLAERWGLTVRATVLGAVLTLLGGVVLYAITGGWR